MTERESQEHRQTDVNASRQRGSKENRQTYVETERRLDGQMRKK